jgi:DNA-binding GntR family transcriptional regulator
MTPEATTRAPASPEPSRPVARQRAEPQVGRPFLLRTAPLASTERAVDVVYDQILQALHEGRLPAGQRLHDGELATQLGVSRTPVREALLRLRHLGVLEFSPARFTRVALVDAEQTGQAVVAWVAVFAAITADAMTAGVPEATIEAMAEAHERFRAAAEPYALQALAAANADFYDQLVSVCSNPLLVRCLDGVVHVLRLGLLQLPGPLNAQPLIAAQAALLAALRASDVGAARRAVYGVARIPLRPPSLREADRPPTA